MHEEVQLTKRFNLNAVRTSHYPTTRISSIYVMYMGSMRSKTARHCAIIRSFPNTESFQTIEGNAAFFIPAEVTGLPA